ncbi:MAG: SEC-C metal-binding domain-containing protein [Syntrophobacteraceae bacterium]
MEENRNVPGDQAPSPLQPVHELIQGGDPDKICLKYGLTRTQLDKMLTEYQISRRQAALADSFTVSHTKRNDPCPCGSGKKYKKCCLPKHEEARKFVPREQLREMEERARLKEKVEKDIRKGFEFIFVEDYARAGQYAQKQLETYPEDDRFHDMAMIADIALGDYDSAFRTARKRWQTATEERLFYQENGYHKREGVEKDRHVHFYSPSTWLEKFWVTQKARAWREQYPIDRNSEIFRTAEKLRAANDLKRFPSKQEEGFAARREALAPVLDALTSLGPAAVPCLLPLTYNFTWASLFVPELLCAYETDECLHLLAELSMFRYPYFSQMCLSYLEHSGERAIPVIARVLSENPAYEELKAGLLVVLGNVVSPESFAILAKYTENENRYIANWACEAISRHKNPEAMPYLEKAKERLGALDKIAGAIKEIAEMTK